MLQIFLWECWLSRWKYNSWQILMHDLSFSRKTVWTFISEVTEYEGTSGIKCPRSFKVTERSEVTLKRPRALYSRSARFSGISNRVMRSNASQFTTHDLNIFVPAVTFATWFRTKICITFFNINTYLTITIIKERY